MNEATANEATVFRVVRRRVEPANAPAYEALVRAMFDEARHFPGYLSAELIPPHAGDDAYQIVQRFATPADLERWNGSPQRQVWMDKLRAVAGSEPEYRLLHGLDAWFGPAALPVGKPPPRWRLTVVSWLGIFPTVALLLTFVLPLLAPLPFLLRTGVFTALVAVLMSYVIMPRLTRWLGGWLRR